MVCAVPQPWQTARRQQLSDALLLGHLTQWAQQPALRAAAWLARPIRTTPVAAAGLGAPAARASAPHCARKPPAGPARLPRVQATSGEVVSPPLWLISGPDPSLSVSGRSTAAIIQGAVGPWEQRALACMHCRPAGTCWLVTGQPWPASMPLARCAELKLIHTRMYAQVGGCIRRHQGRGLSTGGCRGHCAHATRPAAATAQCCCCAHHCQRQTLFLTKAANQCISCSSPTSQGFTLAALGAIAAVTFLEEGTATPRTSEERLPGATAGVAAAK